MPHHLVPKRLSCRRTQANLDTRPGLFIHRYDAS